MTSRGHVLVGNSFPLSLIRRQVTIAPVPLDHVRRELAAGAFVSFWGHRSTLHVANALLGVDVTPTTERPALSLTPDNLPTLDGIVCRACYVLSPDYIPGFRPQPGEQVEAEKITGWQALRMEWDGRV
jgi:hypothetical protein